MNGFDHAISTLSGRFGRVAFSPLMTRRCSVFLLHRIANPEQRVGGHTIDFVRLAIKALRESGAEIVSLRRMAAAYRTDEGPGKNWVAFTIDDGFADQAELLEQVFLPAECPVTVFLISGFVDRLLWPWDDQLSYVFRHAESDSLDVQLEGRAFRLNFESLPARIASLKQVRDHLKASSNNSLYDSVAELARAADVHLPAEAPPEYRPMSWDQVRALAGRGVDFAPHSVTHRIFSRLPAEVVRSEIEQSRSRLRSELGTESALFAWPTGGVDHFTRRDELIAQELGMVATFATGSDYAYASVAHARSPDALPSLRRFGLPHCVRNVLQYGSWIERGKQLIRGGR